MVMTPTGQAAQKPCRWCIERLTMFEEVMLHVCYTMWLNVFEKLGPNLPHAHSSWML